MQALQLLWLRSHGKERLKRKALRRPRKTDIEGVDVTCWDRLCQVRAAEFAETGKARLPTGSSVCLLVLSRCDLSFCLINEYDDDDDDDDDDGPWTADQV